MSSAIELQVRQAAVDVSPSHLSAVSTCRVTLAQLLKNMRTVAKDKMSGPDLQLLLAQFEELQHLCADHGVRSMSASASSSAATTSASSRRAKSRSRPSIQLSSRQQQGFLLVETLQDDRCAKGSFRILRWVNGIGAVLCVVGAVYLVLMFMARELFTRAIAAANEGPSAGSFSALIPDTLLFASLFLLIFVAILSSCGFSGAYVIQRRRPLKSPSVDRGLGEGQGQSGGHGDDFEFVFRDARTKRKRRASCALTTYITLTSCVVVCEIIIAIIAMRLAGEARVRIHAGASVPRTESGTLENIVESLVNASSPVTNKIWRNTQNAFSCCGFWHFNDSVKIDPMLQNSCVAGRNKVCNNGPCFRPGYKVPSCALRGTEVLFTTPETPGFVTPPCYSIALSYFVDQLSASAGFVVSTGVVQAICLAAACQLKFCARRAQ